MLPSAPEHDLNEPPPALSGKQCVTPGAFCGVLMCMQLRIEEDSPTGSQTSPLVCVVRPNAAPCGAGVGPGALA